MQTRRHVSLSVLSLVLGLISVTAQARPPQWQSNQLDLTWQADGTKQSYDFKTFLTAVPDSGLSFTISSVPPFATFIPDTASDPNPDATNPQKHVGMLAGTPKPTDANTFTFQVIPSASGDNGSILTVNLKVVGVANCPGVDLAKGIALGNASENEPFSSNAIGSACTDPNGGSLSYKMDLANPANASFAQLTSAGAISWGVLWNANHNKVAAYNIIVDITSSTGGVLKMPVTFNVTRFFRPATWKTSPIALGLAFDDGEQLTHDLAGDVNNQETVYGSSIAYGLSNQPAWLIGNGSVISGTPSPDDVTGNPISFPVTLTQTDSAPAAGAQAQYSANDTVTFTVVHKPVTPVCNLTDGKIDLGATFPGPVSYDLSQFCNDPSGKDKLLYSFSAFPTPQWGSVSSSDPTRGFMTGTALVANVGVNNWTLVVKNAANTALSVSVPVTLKVNPHAIKWDSPAITLSPNAVENVTWNADLNPHVIDPDKPFGDKYTCALVGSSDWLTVTQDCKVSGTPKAAHIGTQTFSVKVANATSNDTTVITIGVTGNHAPTCVAGSATMAPNPKERADYSNKTTLLSTDVASDPTYQAQLTYSLVSGPEWLKVAANGTVTGKPSRADVTNSPESFVVKVTNPINQSCNATVKVTVDKDARAPQCTALTLESTSRVPFTGILTGNAQDLDGEKLTYAVGTMTPPAPTWLATDANGNLAGTPPDQPISQPLVTQNFLFTATNEDGLSCQIPTTMNIHFNAHPPIPNNSVLQFTVKERQTPTYDLADQAQPPQPPATGPYISNPDNATLSCTVVGTKAAFITLNADCSLQLKPTRTEVSATPYTLNFKVAANGGTGVNATAKITVVKDPRQPQCTALTLNATSRVPFTGVLTAGAQDLDGEKLTYNEATMTPPAPAWLATDASGNLSGTPPDQPVTQPVVTQNFLFTATNEDGLSCQIPTTMNIHFNSHPPIPNNTLMQFTVKERQTPTYNLYDQSQPPQPPATGPYISNPDNATLSCTVVGTKAAFITLNPDCSLQLAPKRADVSATPYALNFKVSANGGVAVNATATITVVKDPRAPQCKDLADTATARVKYTGSVRTGATDLDGETLTFAQTTTTPPWLTSDATGITGGTPTDQDVTAEGAFETFAFKATNQDGLFCSFNLNLTVKFNPHPPVANNATMRFEVKERSDTSYALGDWNQPTPTAPWITNPDHLTLTCTPQTQGFVSLDANCNLHLLPKRADIGTHTFNFVFAGGSFTNIAGTATIIVVKDPRDPKCTDLTLSASARLPFTGTLAGGAQDLDGETLSYVKKVATPAWLVTTTGGALSGTPSDDDQAASPEKFIFTATNQDNRSCDINVTMNIAKTPHDIVANNDQMVFQVKEKTTSSVWLADPAKTYITNQDGVTLTCSNGNGPAFVTIDAQCNLKMAPQHKDVQDAPYTYTFTIAGGPKPVTGTAKITVLRDPQKPIWSPTSFTFLALANQAFTGTVGGSVTEPDGYPLTYTLNSCPTWLKINATSGALSGTPAESDVAVSNCTVTAANPYQMSANANVKVKVVLLKWTQNPVVLPDIRVGDAYSPPSLSTFVTVRDPENANDAISFSRVTQTAAWAQLAATGGISGTPAASDTGANTFTARVTDANNLHVDAAINIKVLRAIVPPGWNTTPIHLPDATQDTAYQTSVSQYITNPDNLPITCSKAPGDNNGPAWLKVNTDCSITGTPVKTDVTARYDVILQVSDGQHPPATVPAYGAVLPLWLPPTVTQPIALQIKEREAKTVLFYPQYVQTANDGDKLTCAITSTAMPWLKMASDCSLTMTPQHPNIGKYTVSFTTTNLHGQSTPGVFTVEVLRDAQPPVCPANLTFTTKALQLFSQTVGNACHDLDNVSLTYAAAGQPGWMAFNGAGNMLGTPQESDVGTVSFQVTASNDGKSTTFTVTVIVQTSIVPPICDNPITLPDAKVGKNYIQSIASHCRDPLGGTLTYKETSPVDWVSFSTSGSVLGNPKTSDIGPHQYSVEVRNSKGSVTTQVIINVIPPTPPGWTQDPINLGKQVAEQLFQFDLNPYIKNPDGTPYTCTKVPNTGPAWLFVSADCHVSGTPHLADLGQYTVSFSVGNGGGQSASVGAYGEVIKIDPPSFVVNSLDFTLNENEIKSYNLNSPQYVINTANDALTFSCSNCEPWVGLTTVGGLTLSPKHPQVGDHTYTVVVTNAHNLSSPPTPMNIHVKHVAKPPVCDSPQLFNAHVGQGFVGKIACTDPSGTGLSFSKSWDTDSPMWLTVSAVGTMSGTPGTPNIGQDDYIVSVNNGIGDSIDVRVSINVLADTPHDDQIAVDDSVPWATPVAENLWVLDSAGQCGQQSTLIRNFKSNMHLYFDALDAAHVEHTGVYIASNQATVNGDKSLTGKPVQGLNGSNILSWNQHGYVGQGYDSNLVGDFSERIDRFKACPCYNSPVWAQFLFYTKYLTGMSEFGKTWFQAKVPMDTVIITDHADYYQHYANNTPQEDWSATDYLAKTFVPPHTQAQKPYRINIIAPKCLQPNGGRGGAQGFAALSRDDHNPGNDNAEPVELTDSLYNQLKSYTKGTYWELDCKYKIDAALTALADQVKFRALVVSKTSIPLSQKPYDPSKIQVFLGGVQLSGDKWQYDATKNVINIFWDKIDLTTIRPGDKIEIKYTA